MEVYVQVAVTLAYIFPSIAPAVIELFFVEKKDSVIVDHLYTLPLETLALVQIKQQTLNFT